MAITLIPSRKVLSGILIGAGALHFLKPEPFDSIVPSWVPGTPRQATLLSGVGELLTGAGLISPQTRKAAAYSAAALFAAVFPANVEMARQWQAEKRAPLYLAIAYGRLPLQIPLIQGALKVAKES